MRPRYRWAMATYNSTSRWSGTPARSAAPAASVSENLFCLSSARIRSASDPGTAAGNLASVESMSDYEKRADTKSAPDSTATDRSRLRRFYACRLEPIAKHAHDHTRTQRHFRLDELGRRGVRTGIRVRQVAARNLSRP